MVENPHAKQVKANSESRVCASPFSLLPPSNVDPIEWSDTLDRVRLHEEAHYTAAGDYAIGDIKYSYHRESREYYRVSGSVTLDTNVDSTKPEASLAKMQAILRTVLAPDKPSQSDLLTAKAARYMIQQIHKGIFPCLVQIAGEYEGHDVCAACKVKFCWGDERQQLRREAATRRSQ